VLVEYAEESGGKLQKRQEKAGGEEQQEKTRRENSDQKEEMSISGRPREGSLAPGAEGKTVSREKNLEGANRGKTS